MVVGYSCKAQCIASSKQPKPAVEPEELLALKTTSKTAASAESTRSTIDKAFADDAGATGQL